MDEGGKWKNEIWTNLRSGRRIRLHFRGAGARPWILEGRNGLACGIHYPLAADVRFPGKQILSGIQWCLNALISAGGYSAYQMVCGSNTMGPFSWDDRDEDLLSA